MKPNNFFIKMFTAHSGLSSKRVCGFLGWIVCLFICIYCCLNIIQAPEIIDLLFICSTSLLGVDSITRIWRKNIYKSNIVDKERNSTESNNTQNNNEKDYY